MSKGTPIGVEAMEGKTYIIGREGHIYVGDSSVSRQHAEIKFIDGRIRLRDLDSTNGTYLVRGDSRVQVSEGYVKPHQPIVFGNWLCTVHNLLVNVGVFATYSDNTGLKIALERET
jgi:hypothetical protein